MDVYRKKKKREALLIIKGMVHKKQLKVLFSPCVTSRKYTYVFLLKIVLNIYICLTLILLQVSEQFCFMCSSLLIPDLYVPFLVWRLCFSMPSIGWALLEITAGHGSIFNGYVIYLPSSITSVRNVVKVISFEEIIEI